MIFLYFIGGLILGYILRLLISSCKTTVGVLNIDHETKQCQFEVTSDDICNPKFKTAKLKINHNAHIPEDLN